MNVDEALQRLRRDLGGARDALQWALDHWEEASDRLLAKLRAVAKSVPSDFDDERYDDGDAFTLYYLIHLFAEKRDQRAYAPLCNRLRRDKNLDVWMGDAASDPLDGLLISLFDGDIESLQQIIETPGRDELGRTAALSAFAYLVRFEHALGDEAALAYLRHLGDTAEPQGRDYFWIGWVETVARLGYSELASSVARVFSKSWIRDNFLSIEDFHAMLAEARSDPKAAFESEGIKPFDSTIALIDSFLAPSPHGGNFLGDPSEGGFIPHVNPMREVGRNDPCPCGSGKKYKKCCLAA